MARRPAQPDPDTLEELESDELLERLAGDEEPIAVGAWDSDTAERARDAIDRSRESFER